MDIYSNKGADYEKNESKLEIIKAEMKSIILDIIGFLLLFYYCKSKIKKKQRETGA